MNYISQAEFTSLVDSNFIFETPPHIGLSISGGADSMALLMLVKDWIKRKSGKKTFRLPQMKKYLMSLKWP